MSIYNQMSARDIGNPDGRRLTRKRLAALSIVFLIALVVAGPWITFKPAPFTGEGSPLRQYTYVLVFGLVLYSAQLRDFPGRLLIIPFNLALALLYCWISLLWSDVPGIAMRRLMLTTIIIWTIFSSVKQVGFDQTLKSLRQIMLWVLVLNFLAAILIPEIGVHQPKSFADLGDDSLAGDWRGILVQKNFAGAFCAATIMIYLFCNHSMRPLLRWGVIVAATLFLIKTSSKTSMGLLAMSILVSWLFARYNPRYRLIALPVVVISAAIATLLAFLNWTLLMSPFQADDALTGRVQIWPVLIAYWQDHPTWGTGYGSFWNVGTGSPVFRYVGATNWVGGLGNGHNGYLDLLVTIGTPGLVLVVCTVFIWPIVRLFSDFKVTGERRGMLLGLLLFCALHNLTETTLFERDTIVNVFLMFALALQTVAADKGAGNEDLARR